MYVREIKLKKTSVPKLTKNEEEGLREGEGGGREVGRVEKNEKEKEGRKGRKERGKCRPVLTDREGCP